MSKIIIIRGEGNSGKTTTAGYLYQDLLKLSTTQHLFDGNPVVKDSLQRNKKNQILDFVAILDIGGKTVVIISAGDIWDDLIEIINSLPNYDVLVCCARTRNSKTFKQLNLKFGKQITHVENIVKQIDDKKSHKQVYIDNIIANI